MNTSAALARHPEPYADIADWRIVTRIFGGLLGPEFVISAGDKTFRVGAPTIAQLERGVPIDDLDLLEVDPETSEAI